MDYLRAAVQYIQPDAVAITESWATEDVDDGELDMIGTCYFDAIDRLVINEAVSFFV